jgi:type IV pilus assembly protein PilN
MIHINLLPHREIRRKEQQQRFVVALGIAVVTGALIVFAGHTILTDKFENQQNRNKYLTGEIAKLDKEIAEINKLKSQTAALLARKQVVESLQTNRAETVTLLEQLVRQLPDGTHLTSIKQTGQRVAIAGVAQSQARVSTLIRNFESSQKVGKPGLVEIRAVGAGAARSNRFSMNISILKQKPVEAQKSPVATGAKKG